MMQELHQTEEFRSWYGKAVRTQPSGNVQKDFSMLCWVVSFSGRICGVKNSFDAWKKSFLKHRTNVVVTNHDELLFSEIYFKYNMKTGTQLGLDDVVRPRMASFTTDFAGEQDYQREYQNDWVASEKLALS